MDDWTVSPIAMVRLLETDRQADIQAGRQRDSWSSVGRNYVSDKPFNSRERVIERKREKERRDERVAFWCMWIGKSIPVIRRFHWSKGLKTLTAVEAWGKGEHEGLRKASIKKRVCEWEREREIRRGMFTKSTLTTKGDGTTVRRER